MSAWDDFLADPSAQRCWLLEIDVFSLAAISDGSQVSAAYSDSAYSDVAYDEGDTSDSSTLYFSSHGFTSSAADMPASTWYDARLMANPMVERRILGRDGVGGLARTNAECKLANADGGLDALLSNYALDGRRARLLVGRETDARSAYGLVFSGVVESVFVDRKEMTVRLSDGAARMDVMANAAVYGGTGSLEGGDDLAGKAKPRCWGKVFNVPPPLVESNLLIYQVNDGQLQDVDAVYDRQIALGKGADYATQNEMETVAPAAGQYRVWKAGGFFRLGSTPEGTCTADVRGDAAGGYVNKHADILQRVLLIAAIDSSLIDAASFAQLNIDLPGEAGIWAGTEGRTVRSLVQEILGVSMFGGFSRLNLFTVGLIKAPAGAPVASYTDEQITELAREPMPGALEPAVWLTRVAWQRNYTVQTDLADTVTAARRTFAAEAERVAKRDDATVKSRRQLAREYGPYGELFAVEADADTEALRRLNLWKDGRGLFRAKLPAEALSRDLGQEINLKHARLGFAAGKNVIVLSHALRGAKVEVRVLA